MFYFVKTPGWLKRVYNSCVWKMPVTEKVIYLTFDDGPHPVVTPYVLAELDKYNAKATFFCIGKNVVANAGVYEQIIQKGHATGNHTYNHLNGWKTNDDHYLDNITAAGKCIVSHLFRPPYGRIRRSQMRKLSEMKIIMWTVLSGDFDTGISNEKCLDNVLKNTARGSIVVFHDSEKAFENLRYALPKVLEYFSEEGYRFEKLN